MGKFYNKRKKNVRDVFKKIHIFCEGLTEKNYFEGIAKSIRRTGTVTISIEEHGNKDLKFLAQKGLKNKDLDTLEEADEVWIVFDHDDRKNFDSTIQQIKTTKTVYKLEAAYSNACFEKWFLLHFENSTSPESTEEYCKKLTREFKKLDSTLKIQSYKKTGKTIKNLYELIKPYQKIAIDRAKKLEQHCNNVNQIKPSERKPSTTVYKLVESLNKLKS
jgi:hypothetical protein